MTLAELGKTYDDFYAPRFELLLGGQVYEQTHGIISGVSVDNAAEKADRFSFTIEGVYDEAKGEFTGLEWSRFETDAEVEIKMGYGDTTETLLVGQIEEHRLNFPAQGAPSVDVSGYGLRHEMQDDSKSRTWDETTHSDVVEEVANEYRFDTVDVESTDEQHAKVVQNDESDLAFVERLASKNGTDGKSYQVTIRRDEFRFGPAPDDEEATVTLAYGDALQSFSPEYRTGSQVGKVEVRGYNVDDAAGVTGTAESDGPGSGTERVHEPVGSQSEAETVAQARLGRIEEDRLSGRGESIGLPEIKAGKPVELERLGERFSKKYYVETATHRVGSEGYTTSFSVRLAEGESVE
jgi:phage protein D